MVTRSKAKSTTTPVKAKRETKNTVKKEKITENISNQEDNIEQNKSPVKILHCKSWNVFKKSANIISSALKNENYSCDINLEKPLRGSFQIFINDKIFFELLDLKRPFKPLRELDLDDLSNKILDELKKQKK